jgi:hypothetical protein
MKKLLTILLTMCSVLTLKSQSDFTNMFDSVFQYVSRTDATTGILYNSVLPFSGFSKGYCNVCQKDTANAYMFYQAYMEMYNASFISTNALPFNTDSLEYLANQNISIVNIGFLHFKYNLFNDSVAMQKLYFDADSILREDTSNHNPLYQEFTSLMIYNKIQIF